MFFLFRIDKKDEICCLIKGCNFLLKNIPGEAFEFKRHANPEYKFQKASPNIFPYLLVNIGSGVSIMKVCFFYFNILYLLTSYQVCYALIIRLNLNKNLKELEEQQQEVAHFGVWVHYLLMQRSVLYFYRYLVIVHCIVKSGCTYSCRASMNCYNLLKLVIIEM